MRVVLDTSTFIKATLERDKTTWQCIRKVMSSYQIIATEEMAKELLVSLYIVAGRKAKNPLPSYRIAALLLLQAKLVENRTVYPWCYDPEDAMFIECAIDGEANFVISNDKSLTTLKDYVTNKKALEMVSGIQFLTPEDFLKLNIH